MIDQVTIERIFSTADIIDVVQDFVTLKKRGANHLGLCPFHNEKTPSFTVSAAKGIFKCFGCGKGGNVVNFVMEHEHLSYYEALKYIARKYNIEIIEREKTEEDIKLQNERDSLLIVTSYAQKYFTDILKNNDEGNAIGLSYFKERGIRDEFINKFELGYCPDGKNKFTKQAISDGYKLEYLVKSGLTIEKDTIQFDRFSGRVIFPIHGLSGNVIGFGGRTLRTDKNTAKYLNSPESEIYHKGKILYGLFFAKKSIVQSDKCYLVEGYTDVLALHQAGVENVVASSGTALTIEQIRLIKRFTPNITILYDGDEAGIKASLRGLDLILEEGMNVKIVLLPEGEDPDSYSRKTSSSEFLKFISFHEQDFITFKTKLLLEDASSDPIKKSNLIADITRSVSVIPDAITRSVYIKECSAILKTDEKVLYARINKLRREKHDQKYLKSRGITTTPANEKPPAQVKYTELNSEAQEKEIIRLLLHFGSADLFQIKVNESDEPKMLNVAEFIIDEIAKDELEFLHPGYKKIFNEYLKLVSERTLLTEKHFINHPDEEIAAIAAELLVSTYPLSKIWARHDNHVETEDMKLKVIVPETIISFKNKKIQALIQETQDLIKEAQQADKPNEIMELQQKFILLNNIKKTFAKDLGNRIII